MRFKGANMRFIKIAAMLMLSVGSLLLTSCERNSGTPNFLFIITDDQSWEHLACYGDMAVKTPNMDRLAREGVRFENAYAACPSCSPSRAAILTGQDIYRLQEGGVLTGFIREEYALFPSILEESGYVLGYTGKGYWPFTKDAPGGVNEPIGQKYDMHRLAEVPEGISRRDYTANFEEFLNENKDLPFFFWLGLGEPHRPYEEGRGVSIGIDTSLIRIPAFFPDVPVARTDMADYLAEVQWADDVVGDVLKVLESRDLKKNTVIIFTSDNGMPFPRAKATLYNHGVKMPLIIAWDKKIKSMRVLKDPVNLIDLAPTILELSHSNIPEQMTGQSMSSLLLSDSSSFPSEKRDFVVTSFEKHTHCRPHELGFPRRAIHTEEWTYIVNYEADRYPLGNFDIRIPNWDILGDVDPGPLKEFYIRHKTHPDYQVYYDLAFGKVDGEELYNHAEDPDMIQNMADNPDFLVLKDSLRAMLDNYLHLTKDPRAEGKSPWDEYRLDK
jgi:uncharacterized sulfatase